MSWAIIKGQAFSLFFSQTETFRAFFDQLLALKEFLNMLRGQINWENLRHELFLIQKGILF